MSSGLTLTLAFVTGLGGAGHCLGMCSGIAGGPFVCRGGAPVQVIQYHATRILIYGVLGAAGAAAGRVLLQQGLMGKAQGLIMMAAGIAIIVLGVWRLTTEAGANSAGGGLAVGLDPPRHEPTRLRGWQAISAGAVNGLVPCALTTSIAIAGAATADPVRAALLMVAFGLGTLPTMALVSLGGAAIGRRVRGVLARVGGLTVCLMGTWTLYEGWIFFDVMRGLGNW